MEIKDGTAVIHVTEVGGCLRRAILRAKGTEPTNQYYDAQVGTAVHQVCEEVMKQLQAGVPMNLGLAMETVHKEKYTTNLFWDQAHVDIEAKVNKLRMWLEQEANDAKEFRSAEKTMTIEIQSVWGLPTIVSGTLDLEYTDEIVDLKSGKTRNKKQALQISAYSYLNALHQPPYINQTKPGRIVYLGEQFDEKVYKNGKRTRKHERVVPVEDIIEYFNEWNSMLTSYVDGLNRYWDELPDPEECGDCFFCQFKDMCFGRSEYNG